MGAAPRSHSGFSGDKAPADLILKRHELNLLENKIIGSTWFIDHCILSNANGIQRETKVMGRSWVL